VTLSEHMPSAHRAMADWSPERFLSWAGKFGSETEAYVRYLLGRREHPEQAYKTCAGILRMGEGCENTFMETACRTALDTDVYSYKYFNMLLKKLRQQQEQPRQAAAPVRHGNLRGSAYYGGNEHV
jgi:hypothetical protein